MSERISKYLKYQKEAGFKKGDKAQILRKAPSRELGWTGTWVPEMDKFVGIVGKIHSFYENSYVSGVCICFDEECWNFPYFILQKVADAEEEEVEVYKVVRKLMGRLMSCRATNFGKGIEYKMGEYVSAPLLYPPEAIRENNLLAAFNSYEAAKYFAIKTGTGTDLIYKALAKGVSDKLPYWPLPEGTIMCREIKLVEEVEKEQTYRIGDKFRQSFSGTIWGIINCSGSIPRVVLAQWESGYLYNSAQKVKNIHHITQEEFSKICNGYENEFELIEEK